MDFKFIYERFGAGWKLIVAAPELVLLIAAVVAVAAWWLKGRIDQGTVEGLREQINAMKARVEALEERRQLSLERVQQAAAQKERAEAEVRKLDEQLMQLQEGDKIPVYALAQISSAARSSIAKLGEVQEAAATSLSPTSAFAHPAQRRSANQR